MILARALLYAIGVVSNCFAFIVLRLMKHKGSSILYLETLAVADTVNCLTGLFGRELIMVSKRYPFESIRFNLVVQQYFRHIYSYVDAIFQMTTTTSPWLLFALSIDRYVAIRYPLSARRICSIQNAFRISVATWVATFIFDIPTIWDKEAYVVNPDQPCSYIGRKKSLLLNKQYAMYYDFVFGKVVVRFIPGLIVLACNVHMSMLVLEAARLRQKLQQIDENASSANSKQGRQITFTILALNVVYMVEYVMAVLNTFLPAVLPANEGRKYRPFQSVNTSLMKDAM
ncbi:FMRFamide receptor-like [Tubulanus polymorphus]|uniref:FMRFamide receptor-like n=1 Tax=Tubulanus polymorphus TaxID=672921 RepID=UPI003DA22A8A